MGAEAEPGAGVGAGAGAEAALEIEIQTVNKVQAALGLGQLMGLGPVGESLRIAVDNMYMVKCCLYFSWCCR